MKKYQIVSIIFTTLFLSSISSCSRFKMDKDVTETAEIAPTGDGSGDNIEDYDFTNFDGKIDSKDDVKNVFESEVNKSLFETTSAIPGAIPGVVSAIPATATSDSETTLFFKRTAKSNPMEKFLNSLFRSVNFDLKYFSLKAETTDSTDIDYEYPFTSEGLPMCVTILEIIPVATDLTIVTSLLSKSTVSSYSAWEEIATPLRVDDTALKSESKKLFNGFSITIGFADGSTEDSIEGCEVKIKGDNFKEDSTDVDTLTLSGIFTGSWSFVADSEATEVKATASVEFTKLSVKGPGGGAEGDTVEDCVTVEFNADGNMSLSSILSSTNDAPFRGDVTIKSDGLTSNIICCLDIACADENKAEASLAYEGNSFYRVETTIKGAESLYAGFVEECDDNGENCSGTKEEDLPFDESATLSLQAMHPGDDGSIITDFDINSTILATSEGETNSLAIDLALMIKVDFTKDGVQKLIIHEGNFGLQFDAGLFAGKSFSNGEYFKYSSEECVKIEFKLLHKNGEVQCVEYVSLDSSGSYKIECTYDSETFDVGSEGDVDTGKCE